MATITHQKTNNIADWTQADLDAQIAAGFYPPGTTLADITLPTDWNNNHTFVLGADENFVTDAQLTTIGNTSGTNTGDQNLFSTISVSGQSNIVADTTSDTLTFVAGTGVTITTDALTDSITINATGGGTGDVVGPASATDNAIARYDTTTGKLIQNSAVTIADTTGVFAGSQGFTFTGSTPSYVQGLLAYDTTNECMTFFNNDSNVALQIGQEEWIRVRNVTGSTIPNGAAVYINGANSGLPTIALAQANASTTTVCAGLATEAIANGTTGYVTSIGLVRGLDTSTFSIGNIFLSATTPGALTQTAPSAPNFRYRVGFVTAVSATIGTIHVTPTTAALGNGTANQVFGMNTAGTAQEVKSITGTANQVTVTNATNSIALSLPATINVNTSGTAAIATTVTAANEATDTTCFPLFVTAATGNLGPKTNANLTFNSNTGAFGATSFAGAGTGLTGTAASLTAGTVTTNANLTGDVTSVGNATTIVNNAVTTAKINNDAVTLAKIQNATANSKLLGSGASGSGSDYVEITLGTNLSMSGTTLNASGGGGSSPVVVSDTPSASQNDYAPGTFSSTTTQLKIAPTNSIKITGLVASGFVDGQEVTVTNTLAENTSASRMIIFENQSSSSTAANRFYYKNMGVPLILMPNESQTFIYDTTLSRWRLKSDGGRVAPYSRFDVFDDGHSIGLFTVLTSGTGASAQAGTYQATNSTYRPVSVWQMDTGTTTTGYVTWGSGSSMSLTGGCALSIIRAAPEINSTSSERFQIRLGWHDGTSAEPSNGAYWEYDDAVSTDWRRVTANSATRTKNTETGFTVGTNMTYFGIFLNGDASQADFFYSLDGSTWTIGGSNSSNMPTAANFRASILKTVGSSQRNLSMDFMGMAIDNIRGT